MKTINIGSRYEIYDDSLKTYGQLPAQSYVVRFSKMSGFFLEQYHDITVTEEKAYGVHNEKVAKVLNTFSAMERNLGVILSGDKGIGKSLFAKMLAISAIGKGIPVVVVDKFYPGIASYLEQIDQEILILFDEFDKTFGTVQQADNEADPQSTLLGLFDGIVEGKKLFVITCNRLTGLNDFLLNRPGRFHYHFRFTYPDGNEIRTYLQDKTEETYWGEIDEVVRFSKRVKLNYDCLRSIAFELNTGIKFNEVIKDLNILNIGKEQYRFILRLNDGTEIIQPGVEIDLFDKTGNFYKWIGRGEQSVLVSFNIEDVVYNDYDDTLLVPQECIGVSYDEDEDDGGFSKHVKETGIANLTMVMEPPRTYHYGAF